MCDLPPIESVASGSGIDPLALDFLKVTDLLLNAEQLAKREKRPIWDFALEVADLLRAGLTHHHLRWLSAEGLADFGEEIERRVKSSQRKFHLLPRPVISFPEKACCVLTSSGHELFYRLKLHRNDRACLREGQTFFPAPPAPSGVAEVPNWDGAKKLFFRGTLIHEFRQPAPFEKAILNAFQGASWKPNYIDNPLFSDDLTEREEKAINAVKKLNKHQDPQLLTFFIIDKGKKIGWRARR